MTHVSHRRAITTAPHYGLTASAPHRQSTQARPHCATGHRSRTHSPPHAHRSTRALAMSGPPSLAREPSGVSTSNGRQIAWTLLLVANVAALALPVHANVPRCPAEASPVRNIGLCPEGAEPVGSALSATTLVTPAWPDVVINRMAPEPIKLDYSFDDVLKALASAREPFRNLGESMADVYTTLTGNEVDPEVRAQLRMGTTAVDLLTSLLPGVALPRLGGEIAQIVADQREGKPVDSSRLISVLINTNLRGMESLSDTSVKQVHSVARGHQPMPKPYRERLHEPRDTLAPQSQELVIGESEYLQGYAQPLGAHVLSPEAIRPVSTDTEQGILVARGDYFIRGTGGYYRMQRQKSDNQWLVAARGPGKPQVPVTYDAATQKWRAHAPLRLYGGGGGISKEASPPAAKTTERERDSVFSVLFDLVGIPEPVVRAAIRRAFLDLGYLRLLRTNRADLRQLRDNSIVAIRERLTNRMRDIDRHASLFDQQRQAAKHTALYYLEHPNSEAFCQENAEVLLYFMLMCGVPSSRIRMITLHAQNRPAHVMLLYTESPALIGMLETATPQPPIDGQIDGLTQLEFESAILSARYRSRLFDPWSRTKMVTFEHARSEREVSEMLAPTLEDMGFQRGEPYRISITRPLGKPAQKKLPGH
ncbi:hypothetical protein PPN31114_02515 [Pandoraea pneumonica]|jgi:hypothetical protein|uniref:Uncharacterized protein n=1 Tax=Pandoraea pneumonica TaxID=2508299 RepID=A0A5E4V8J3_9BURK|nr:hypothetical protein PPN31114_02515 [Pandoraea pneumonica]